MGLDLTTLYAKAIRDQASPFGNLVYQMTADKTVKQSRMKGATPKAVTKKGDEAVDDLSKASDDLPEWAKDSATNAYIDENGFTYGNTPGQAAVDAEAAKVEAERVAAEAEQKRSDDELTKLSEEAGRIAAGISSRTNPVTGKMEFDPKPKESTLEMSEAERNAIVYPYSQIDKDEIIRNANMDVVNRYEPGDLKVSPAATDEEVAAKLLGGGEAGTNAEGEAARAKEKADREARIAAKRSTDTDAEGLPDMTEKGNSALSGLANAMNGQDTGIKTMPRQEAAPSGFLASVDTAAKTYGLDDRQRRGMAEMAAMLLKDLGKYA